VPGDRQRKANVTEAVPLGADELDAGIRPKKKPSKKPSRKPSRKPPRARTQPTLGWREWVGLPDHGVEWLKAKVDTGARTSSLHAAGLHTFQVENREWVRFHVYPWQRSTADAVQVEARVLDRRQVRSSSGSTERRPVVILPVRIGSRTVDVEFTLTRRDQMGFRMLLGRQALRRRFLVDTGRSYLLGQPPRPLRRTNRSTDAGDRDDTTAASRPDGTTGG
jgi:hypothetical protein